MLIIFGLMLVLLQTVSCVDQICSFNQTETCYAALGDKLSLQMIQDIHISNLNIKKEERLIYKKQKERIFLSDLFNRSDVIISDSTVIINSVTRAYSGNYTLQLYDLQGTLKSTTDLQVNVEAPVASVNVLAECISKEWVVSCSSEGDSLFFNWSLNGQPLAQGNKTINLDGKIFGNIICSVKNHISHGEKSTTVTYCPGTTTASVTTHLTPALTNSTSVGTSLSASNLTRTQKPGLFSPLNLTQTEIIGMGSSIVILIVLVITVCYIYKKKQAKSAAADGGTELVYADINHDKLNRDNKPTKTEMSSAADVEYAEVASQRKTKKKKGKEDEVQYGEVSFTPAGRNVQKQHTEQDECVYSQIYQKK
ncbi:uncharacterized protein [Misgurnus anguillicaudatus]|uniref:uncharacterized protein n=1 Tax=Misgurnus anguillicaudatus TaxID=75329 RepID=UPI003CCFAE7E